MIDTEKLLDNVDLVALVELAGARLRKTGRTVRGACPLHGGDNPTAFSVFTEDGRQLWRCWSGCNTGGDAIHFVQRWKGLDFKDAVRWLADYARIPLEELGVTPERAAERQEEEKRSEVLELAAQFYRAQFQATPRAQEYARGRGFTDTTIERAGFGFSDGRGLPQWLADHKADLDAARKIGLVRKDGHDFTANAKGLVASPDGWLIYVHRERERVVSFSARALAPVDPGDKSRNLPGERRVYRAEVPGSDVLVLVEGQADAETLRQLGIGAWALCGASLSERDVEALRRRKPVYLALDSDKVGQKRVQDVAGAIGPLVMVAPVLPDSHKDLNAWLTAGADLQASQVQAWLGESRPWIDLAIKAGRSCPAYEMEEQVEQVAQLIAKLPEKMRGQYVRRASKALDVPARDLRMQANGANGNGHAPHEWAEVRDGRLYYRGELLGHFTAQITHELVVDDGQNLPKIRYTVAGKLAEGEALDTLDVEADDFDGMKWLASWGARALVDVPPGRAWMLSRAIKGLSLGGMKQERVHTYSGWATVDQRQVFLTASGAITPDGFDAQVRVDLGLSHLRYYRLPAPPDEPREAMQASLSFLRLAPARVTYALWAAMYAAPFTSLYPLNAILWVYGTTQSRKSTLVHLALAHFGPLFIKGREFRAPCDWMSTLTALEGAMFAAKDLPLVIDDFRPQASSSSAHNMKAKVDAIIRCVGNRSARGRANADLSERQQRPPRSLVIATSELPLSDQSTVGRMIVVPVDKGDIAVATSGEGPLDQAQRLAGEGGPGLYAEAMAGYVRRLATDWPRTVEQLATDIEEANQYARSVFPSSQSRLMDYYAVLVTGARMGLRYAADTGALTRKEAARLAQEAFPQALTTLLLEQSKLVSGQSPMLRFFQALDDLLAQEKVYLAPRKGGAVSPPVGAVLIGWYGHEEDSGARCLYLLTEPCVQQAREYWLKAGEAFDVSADAVKREMWQAGVLVRKNENQYDSTIWVSKIGSKRALVVDVAKLTAAASVALWPEDTA
jgi:DNA primase catalytic core